MFASHQQQMLKARFTDSIALPLNIHLIQRLAAMRLLDEAR